MAGINKDIDEYEIVVSKGGENSETYEFHEYQLEEKRPNRPYTRDTETIFDILKATIFKNSLKHVEF